MDKLPLEILNMIGQHLMPKEMARLSMSNRWFWYLLGMDVTRAKDAWNKYHLQKLNCKFQDEWKLLWNVYKNPILVAPFIDEVIFYKTKARSNHYTTQNNWEPVSDLGPEGRTRKDLLSTIEDNPYLQLPLDFMREKDSYNSYDWQLVIDVDNAVKAALVNGSSYIAITQLLFLLPNLTRLELHISCNEYDRMTLMFLKRLNADYVAKADATAKRVLWSSTPLQNLREIRLHEGGNRSGMLWLHMFCQLPSVETIKSYCTRACWGNNVQEVYHDDRILVSNVTTLEFHSCRADISAISRLLQNTNRLETFIFKGTDQHGHASPRYGLGSARDIIKTLLQHSAKSLRILRLEGQRSTWSDSLSATSKPTSHTFRDFENLEILVCFWPDIVPKRGRSPKFSLSEMLPPNLRHLGLVCCPENESNIALKWLEEIQQSASSSSSSSSSSFTNLKSIYIGPQYYGWFDEPESNHYPNIKAAAEKAGIAWNSLNVV